MMLKKCAMAIVLIAASVSYSGEIVRVDRIVDGDTFTTADGRRVRLHGIDAPERGQPWGAEAAGWLAVLIDDRDVELENPKLDQYGRTVAELKWRNMDVGEAMVILGHAWVDTRYTAGELERRYVALQSLAQTRRVGLWQRENPIRPWDWRAQKRQPAAMFGSVIGAEYFATCPT